MPDALSAKADPKSRRLTLSRVQQEVGQGHQTRQALYQRLEAQLGKGKKVVAFFTSFFWPVILQDADADMLEEVLRNTLDPQEQLVLLLNCPGGEALAAERVISVCRSYSHDGFIVVVPKMAKSAATMICLGANEIWMSPTSELGPIDPQIPVQEPGRPTKYLAAHEIVESYNELITQANETKGRIEPYLQQLNRYDARDIRRIQSAQKLSESIAVRSLHTGAMANRTEGQIKNKIKPLLQATYSKVHGRPFYSDLVQKCGLPVKLQDVRGELWQTVWEIYIRLNNLVTAIEFGTSKVVESATDSYAARAFMPTGGE